MRVAEEDQPILCIITPEGPMTWEWYPFGGKRGSAEFQMRAPQVFGELEGVATFIDDVLGGAREFPDMLEKLRQVLALCRKYRFHCALKKCFFGTLQASFLGHVIGNGTVRPDPSKIKAIQAFPLPKDSSEVKAFMGMNLFYANHLPYYSVLAAVFTDKIKGLKENTAIEWTDEEVQAFLAMKPRKKELVSRWKRMHPTVP